MKTLKIKMTLTEEMLGMTPGDPEIYQTFIGSKAPDADSIEEEVAALGVDAIIAKGKTIFPNENGVPFMWDYQIKGWCKDACGMLRRVADTKSGKLKAYVKVIDGMIFPKPRKIMIKMPELAKIGECQRPLRVRGPQGERVCLSFSETVPAGSVIEFDMLLLDDGLVSTVKEWLDYGELRGLGQWRNSGKGRFLYEMSE